MKKYLALFVILFITIVVSYAQTCDEYWDNASRDFLKGDFVGAITDMTNYIELKPNDPVGYYNRGLAIIKAKFDYRKAVKDFTKAIELESDIENKQDYYLQRGLAYAYLYEYANAIRDNTSVIEINQNNAQAYNNRGVAYYNIGEKRLACSDLKMACNLGYPNSCNAYKDLCK